MKENRTEVRTKRPLYGRTTKYLSILGCRKSARLEPIMDPKEADGGKLLAITSHQHQLLLVEPAARHALTWTLSPECIPSSMNDTGHCSRECPRRRVDCRVEFIITISGSSYCSGNGLSRRRECLVMTELPLRLRSEYASSPLQGSWHETSS